jgi:HEAT repeat protein
MGTAAAPADTTDESDPVAKATLLRLLNSDSPTKQERAVRLIGMYAHSDRYDADYFRVLVTPLHGIVAAGQTEAVRIMAVSALSAIGTERAMQGLKDQVDGLKPKRVQTLTRYALAAYTDT